jgi:uncharacterized protein (TIGR03032 family)
MPDSIAERTVQCSVSEGFADWIERSGGSIAITTYQAGKVALVGWNGRQVHFTMRQFERPMGLAVDGSRMALATQTQLLLLTDAPLLAPDYLDHGRYDALYLPRVAYHTGPINLHDLAFSGETLWAVNTRFGCLITPSADFSFVPRWQPHFLTQLAPEDRCHLNGLATIAGRPAFVTALGRTDIPRGWVPTKATGGILMHVDSNEIVMDGLCMPHSPRWHDGKLWLLNSGLGELSIVDPQRGSHSTVAALPGYVRGLHFVGPYALIGLSKVRTKHIFDGLPVQKRYDKLLCGVAIVDTRDGRTLGTFEFTEAAEELYDVAFLPGVQRPTIFNPRREETEQAVTAPDFSYWIKTQTQPDTAPVAAVVA